MRDPVNNGAMTDRIRRADIVDVALRLLAGGGLHALAMRRIATELGIQQSALYWHFDNKQQLLGSVADHVVAPVALATGGSWQTRITTLTSRLRGALLRFPDGAELVATAFAFRLGAQQPLHQLTDELQRSGLQRDDAEVAASVLLHFVFGYATDEQQHHQAAALGAIEPNGEDHTTAAADERFVKGIQLILSGVGVQVTAARAL